MKKKAFLKLMEKYPADADIAFKVGEDFYYTARLEIEDNFEVVESEYDEEKDVDIPLKVAKVEKNRIVRLEIE